MTPGSGSACATHPDVPAVDTCQRCGTFLCGECVVVQDDDVWCARCVQVLALHRPRGAQLSFAVALLALPLGVVASRFFFYLVLAVPLVLITAALALYRKDRSVVLPVVPPSVRAWRRAALVLVVLDITVLSVFAAVLAVIWLRLIS